MIKVGVVGATGYAGEELIEILLRHPDARITNISAKIAQPQGIHEIFPKFKGRTDLICGLPDPQRIVADCDCIFLALPHTVSMDLVPLLLKQGRKVIDLSADYRIKDGKVYEKFYNVKQRDPVRLAKAVYGLPEIYRAKIREAELIANPGCYPTVSLLALAPLVALSLVDFESIIIDAKSGVTGAGRKLAEGLMFAEVSEDFKAYKIDNHQHAPEIDQELSKLAGRKLKVTFVPHLLPLSRGILATIYVKKNKKSKQKSQKIIDVYKKFYKKEPFVRIREEGDYPRLKDVVNSNFCDIGIKDSPAHTIIVAAIDNLLKGAAGQAVQNMNIMYGLSEKTAL